jgi:MFS family permease
MEVTGKQEEQAIQKSLRHLMPVLILAFVISYIDRQNVAFAKLQMVSALRMTETGYGLGSSLFFIGYILFDVPSSLAVHRYGARLWLARIMGTWGIVTILLAFASSPVHFFVLRFLLGAAEAGFYPGCIYYLTLWFPREHRVKALGLFTLGAPLGSMLGSVAGGALLDLNGKLGLAGWQWTFLMTGLPALLMTGVLLIWLPRSPREARFLSEREQDNLLAAVAKSTPETATHGNPLAALWDARVLGFGMIYMLLSTALYGVNYWLPTIVKGFGISSSRNGLLNMIPWGLAVLLLLALPRRLKGERAVLVALSVSALTGLLCFVSSVLAPGHMVRFSAIAVGAACVQLIYPLFWSITTRFFAGIRAASSVAVINAIGLIGGFLAQNLMPWVGRTTGSQVVPMLVPAACLAVLGLLAMVSLSGPQPHDGLSRIARHLDRAND